MLAPVLVLYFATTSSLPTLPPGKGRATVQRMCSKCHALKVVTSKRASKQQWSMLVDQMVVRGAEGTDKEVESVVNYLAKNFGPTTGAPSAAKSHDRDRAVNVNQATSAELSSSLGLSPEEAASIVAYRQQNGKFKEWRDLTKIPGIQASKIENKKDHLLF